jgi:hypothetical protein
VTALAGAARALRAELLRSKKRVPGLRPLLERLPVLSEVRAHEGGGDEVGIELREAAFCQPLWACLERLLWRPWQGYSNCSGSGSAAASSSGSGFGGQEEWGPAAVLPALLRTKPAVISAAAAALRAASGEDFAQQGGGGCGDGASAYRDEARVCLDAATSQGVQKGGGGLPGWCSRGGGGAGVTSAAVGAPEPLLPTAALDDLSLQILYEVVWAAAWEDQGQPAAVLSHLLADAAATAALRAALRELVCAALRCRLAAEALHPLLIVTARPPEECSVWPAPSSADEAETVQVVELGGPATSKASDGMGGGGRLTREEAELCCARPGVRMGPALALLVAASPGRGAAAPAGDATQAPLAHAPVVSRRIMLRRQVFKIGRLAAVDGPNPQVPDGSLLVNGQ